MHSLFFKSLKGIKISSVKSDFDFLSAAEDFQLEVEQCFDNSGAALVEEPTEINTTSKGEHKFIIEQTIVEVDSQLRGVIFGTEMADRLWGLPNGEPDRKDKETTQSQSVCNFKVIWFFFFYCT